ncbi:TPA: hypothetical protein ACGPA6_001176 [Streptococcus suis]
MKFEQCIHTFKKGDIFFEDNQIPINNFWQIVDIKQVVTTTLSGSEILEKKKVTLTMAHIGFETIDSHENFGKRTIEPIPNGFTDTTSYDQQRKQVISEKPLKKFSKTLDFENSTSDQPKFSTAHLKLVRYTDGIALTQDEEWFENRYNLK